MKTFGEYILEASKDFEVTTTKESLRDLPFTKVLYKGKKIAQEIKKLSGVKKLAEKLAEHKDIDGTVVKELAYDTYNDIFYIGGWTVPSVARENSDGSGWSVVDTKKAGLFVFTVDLNNGRVEKKYAATPVEKKMPQDSELFSIFDKITRSIKDVDNKTFFIKKPIRIA